MIEAEEEEVGGSELEDFEKRWVGKSFLTTFVTFNLTNIYFK